jgi:hypothetical protein
MTLPENSVRLRIYLGESDRHGSLPLHEAIILKARACHLAGATLWRASMGYGASSRLHTAKILRLSEDLPIVIDIVDAEERIQQFLPELDRLMQDGLVTLEPVRVLHYRGRPPAAP